MTFFLNELIEQ